MKGLENQMYLLLLAISNVVAILLIGVSIKWRRLVRICFFILFAWACWINWKASLQTPQEYLEYGNLTLRAAGTGILSMAGLPGTLLQ